MKKLLLITCLFVSAIANAQLLNFDRVIAKRSLFLRDWWVDSIQRDTSFAFKVRSIPTSDAVKRYMDNRLAGLSVEGGGGPELDPVWNSERNNYYTIIQSGTQFYPLNSNPAGYKTTFGTFADVTANGNTTNQSVFALSFAAQTSNVVRSMLGWSTIGGRTAGLIQLKEESNTLSLYPAQLSAAQTQYFPNESGVIATREWVNSQPFGGSDNWGTQVVQTGSYLTGNGTSGSPLSVNATVSSNGGTVVARDASGNIDANYFRATHNDVITPAITFPTSLTGKHDPNNYLYQYNGAGVRLFLTDGITNTSEFLRRDGQWATPPSGGGGGDATWVRSLFSGESGIIYDDQTGLFIADYSNPIWSADRIRTIPISTTTPSNGQSLVYNSTLNEWTPTTLSGSGSGDAYTTIQKDGVNYTQRRIFNFIGGGVTVGDNNTDNRTDIIIVGGGTETDPTVPSYVKSITETNMSNWTGAFDKRIADLAFTGTTTKTLTLTRQDGTIIQNTFTDETGKEKVIIASTNYTISATDFNILWEGLISETLTLPAGTDQRVLFITNTTGSTLTLSTNIYITSTTFTNSVAPNSTIKIVYSSADAKWYRIYQK